MSPKSFTLSVAATYILLAVVGLTLPHFHAPDAPDHATLAVGMLPLSPVHNLVHLVIGLAALLACASAPAARSLSQGLALLLGSAAVVGLLPPQAGASAASASFGLISTDGIWLHAVTALLAAYVGFAPAPRPSRKRAVVGAAVAA